MTVPGVHVNQDMLGALQNARALDRNRLSHTERLLQSTQDMKQSEQKKGEWCVGLDPAIPSALLPPCTHAALPAPAPTQPTCSADLL